MKKLNGLDAPIQVGDVVALRLPGKKTKFFVATDQYASGSVALLDLPKIKTKIAYNHEKDYPAWSNYLTQTDKYFANHPLFRIGDVVKYNGFEYTVESIYEREVYLNVTKPKIAIKYGYRFANGAGSANEESLETPNTEEDEQEMLELEAEALALILQLEENKGKDGNSSSNSTPKYKVGDVFVASNNDRYWKITSILTSNEDVTYFVDEYRKGKSKTYHTDQQSFSESELENKMLTQGAVLQKEKENQNSYPERNGKITADILKKTFAFRYVNVDINLDEKQEQDMLDVSYDTFRQLAMLLNIPTNAIGLGRNLTLNIGLMRMERSTGGCYDNQYRALNFKSLEDFKHIAHEWFHAFDHYLDYANNDPKSLKLFSMEFSLIEVKSQSQIRFVELIECADATPYYLRSADVAKASKFGNYWTSHWELLARAFEIYIKDLMEKHNINNSHLVSLYPNNPYPDYSDPKDKPIQDAFKALFDGLAMKKLDRFDVESLYGTK